MQSVSQCRDAEDSLKAVSDGKQHKCYFLRNFIKTILNTVELWQQKGSGFALVAYVQITVIMGRHDSANNDKNKNFEKGMNIASYSQRTKSIISFGW